MSVCVGVCFFVWTYRHECVCEHEMTALY
uniref:Uncharacterized protein n=1 Tax=Anguilla anguilla TaxID=7936 RepID=A0A0E9QKR5_ANGAN